MERARDAEINEDIHAHAHAGVCGINALISLLTYASNDDLFEIQFLVIRGQLLTVCDLQSNSIISANDSHKKFSYID